MLRPFLTAAPFTYSRDFVAAVARGTITEAPNRATGNVPAELVITGRLNFGLNHILALLGATCAWRETLLPYLYARREDWPAPRLP